MTSPETNQKAGWCSMCRGDMHSMCASESCTCPDRRRHRSRPTYAGRGEASVTPIDQNRKPAPPADERKPAVASPKTPAPEPVIELVEEDPPAAPVKRTAIDQVLELVQQPGFKGGTWFRVAVMPSSRAAGVLATRLSKHELSQRMRLEWRRADAKVFVKGPE